MNTAPPDRSRIKTIATLDAKEILRGKPLLYLIASIAVAVALWGLWRYLYHPPRPWIVRWQISRFLKKNSIPKVFKVNFPFPSRAEMAAAPPKSPAKPELQKGSLTGKEFDALAHDYVDLERSALILERQISEAPNEAEQAIMKKRLEELKQQLANAETAGDTNVAVMKAQVNALQQRVATFDKTAAWTEELKKKEAALEPIRADLTEFQKAWEEDMKVTGLGSGSAVEKARTEFSSDAQNRIEAANSYPGIYQIIGQELWVAERLLASANPQHCRAGMTLAFEASRNARDAAENGWLSARICEGYIWPYLDRVAESNRRSPFYLENLLNECANVFRSNYETNNVIRNYEILLAKAKSPLEADSARMRIAMVYDQMGDWKKELQLLRQIKATNDFRWAVARIPRLEQQLKSNK